MIFRRAIGLLLTAALLARRLRHFPHLGMGDLVLGQRRAGGDLQGARERMVEYIRRSSSFPALSLSGPKTREWPAPRGLECQRNRHHAALMRLVVATEDLEER